MKMRTAFLPTVAAVGCIATLAAIFTFCGCSEDSTSPGDVFYISPASRTLYQDDQSLTLTVVGGLAPFRWILSDTNIGLIDGQTRTVTYVKNENTGVNIATVEDARYWQAQAVITHRDVASAVVTADPETLVTNGAMSVLTVTGGVDPCTWTIFSSGQGYFVGGNTGRSVIYRRDSSGDVVVRMTDADGTTVDTLLTQPGVEGSAVQIAVLDGSTTISTNGGMVVLGAVGGTAPYDWAVSDGAKGHFVGADVGSMVIYMRDDSGGNVVTVEDGSHSTDMILIQQP